MGRIYFPTWAGSWYTHEARLKTISFYLDEDEDEQVEEYSSEDEERVEEYVAWS